MGLDIACTGGSTEQAISGVPQQEGGENAQQHDQNDAPQNDADNGITFHVQLPPLSQKWL